MKQEQLENEGLYADEHFGTSDRDSTLTTLRNYNTHLRKLEKMIERAENQCDEAQLQQCRGEKEWILKEIREFQDTGQKHGKKVRDRVGAAITRAIKLIESEMPELAAHLRENIGPYSTPLCYRPRPPIDWVTAADPTPA
jgi:hypothetical protein